MRRWAERSATVACLAALLLLPASVAHARKFGELKGFAEPPSGRVLSHSILYSGYDIVASSSGGRSDWVKREPDFLAMRYPGGQAWGVVLITVAEGYPLSAANRDYSAFDTLILVMRGNPEGGRVEVGLRSGEQPGRRSAAKRPLELTSEWRTYAIPLREFGDTDLRKLDAVAEFAFSGSQSQTAYLHTVQYVHLPPPPSISSPADGTEIRTESGVQPLASLQGTIGPIPDGWQLCVVVRPTGGGGESWVSDAAVEGDRWSAKVHLPVFGYAPGDQPEFEVFAALDPTRRRSPSDTNKWDTALRSESKLIRVSVRAGEVSQPARPASSGATALVALGALGAGAVVVAGAALVRRRSTKSREDRAEDGA